MFRLTTFARIGLLAFVIGVVTVVLVANRMIRCAREGDSSPSDQAIGSSNNKVVIFTLFGLIGVCILFGLIGSILGAHSSMKGVMGGGVAANVDLSAAPSAADIATVDLASVAEQASSVGESIASEVTSSVNFGDLAHF